jgi:hypothetical protein
MPPTIDTEDRGESEEPATDDGRRERDDMTTSKPITPPQATNAYESLSRSEEIEEVAGLAVAGGLRAVEVAAVVLLGLLVCPPLAILAVVVLLPLLVMALVFGLVVAVLSIPYLLVHHFRRGHRAHASLFEHRLRGAGRALLDLAPHRIVADAGKAVHRR